MYLVFTVTKIEGTILTLCAEMHGTLDNQFLVFEQTIINAQEGISDGTLNNIIRNTMNTSNNDYNIQNDINLNGFDYSQNNYSQSNEIDTTNTYSNQNFNDNNYNIENNDLFNNDNQIDNNSFNENNFNVNELVSNSTGNDNLNYNSYDYQY